MQELLITGVQLGSKTKINTSNTLNPFFFFFFFWEGGGGHTSSDFDLLASRNENAIKTACEGINALTQLDRNYVAN